MRRRPYHQPWSAARLAALGLALSATGASAQVAAANRPLAAAWQVTHALNFEASPSPDGKKLVFVRLIAGRQQLFVTGADGAGEVQITRDEAEHENPVWSPDGRRIAFVLTRDGRRVVHTINPDGAGLEAITPPTVKAIHPSWSPDSRTLLYCSEPQNGEAQIYAIDITSRRVQTLVSGGVNTFAVMSPDGRRIAFRKIISETNADVFVAEADGSNPRNLTNHAAYEGWPAWSPDGRRIAFSGNRNANHQIFIMGADGGDVRLAANTEGRATFPRWSADGRTLYFTNCVKRDFGRGCEIMAVSPPPAPT